MFDRILGLFARATDYRTYRTPLPEADAKHALGALLVRVAQADRAYLFQEVERIDRILARRFNLSILDAAKMRAQCERLAEEMPDTAEIVTILHDHIDRGEREATLAAVWQVVFADGLEHQAEDDLVDLVQRMMGVDPATCARLRAEAIAGQPQRAT